MDRITDEDWTVTLVEMLQGSGLKPSEIVDFIEREGEIPRQDALMIYLTAAGNWICSNDYRP